MPDASEFDWRRARARLESDYTREMLLDREVGKLDASLNESKIRRMAYEKACRACERAIRES